MTEHAAAVIEVSTRPPGAPSAGSRHGLTFHDVLSALNPLQYLPVVGTIYRAVTGDVIPEAVRRVGSLIVSGLMGGPIGIAVNVVVTAMEKITGVDLDRTGQALLHGESLGQAVAARTTALATASRGPHARTDATKPGQHASGIADSAWSPAGSVTNIERYDAAGLHNADALNAWELARLRAARSAYAYTAALSG